MHRQSIREKIAALKTKRTPLTPEQREAGARAYASKKLTMILETLATGAGDARSRLLAASHNFHGIKRDDFPEGKRHLWDAVLKTVARFEPFWESPVRKEFFKNSDKVATWGMRNSTAQRAARQLWELYWSVSSNRAYY